MRAAKRKTTGFVLIAAGMTAGAFYYLLDGRLARISEAKSVDPGEKQAVVSLHKFKQSVVRYCHVEYGAPIDILAPADGVLETVASDQAKVKAGETIARYELEQLENQKQATISEIENLRARFAFRSGPFKKQTEAIRTIERAEAEADRDRLKETADETAKLEQQGQIAPKRLAEARRKLSEAETALNRIAHQQALERAQHKLDLAELSYTIDQSERKLSQIQRDLAKLLVQAPEDGMVIYSDTQFSKNNGGQIRAGRAFAQIVQPEKAGRNDHAG